MAKREEKICLSSHTTLEILEIETGLDSCLMHHSKSTI